MKFATIAFFAAVVAFFASSCANSGRGMDHPAGTGPFDSRGNYVEAWADNPAKWRGGDRKPTPSRSATTPSRPQQATASTQRPTQTAQTRPAASSQPRPQPRPKTRTYTVKRGDTLSGIASRNRTTVAALRRANGISGDLIRPGQVLRIP